jgi:hypothetical protein
MARLLDSELRGQRPRVEFLPGTCAAQDEASVLALMPFTIPHVGRTRRPDDPEAILLLKRELALAVKEEDLSPTPTPKSHPYDSVVCTPSLIYSSSQYYLHHSLVRRPDDPEAILLLKRELALAVKEEDYPTAARLRDHPWLQLYKQ